MKAAIGNQSFAVPPDMYRSHTRRIDFCQGCAGDQPITRAFIARYHTVLNLVRNRIDDQPIAVSPECSYSFVDLLCFFLSCVCYAFVRVCLLVPCGQLLGKGWPLCSSLWCITAVTSEHL